MSNASTSRVILAPVALAVVVVACSTLEPVPPVAPATACTPGQMVSCGCRDGTDGVQTCLADGTHYEDCDCSGVGGDGGALVEGGGVDGGATDGGALDGGGTDTGVVDDGGGPCTGTMIGARCLVTLTVGQDSPETIAVDATGVYFATGDGAVKMCPLSGCGGAAPTTLASTTGDTYAIALDATNAYWESTSAHVVQKCAKTGCNDAPTTLAPTSNISFGLTVDATNVYWTESTGLFALLRKCAIAGCASSPTTVAAAFGAIASPGPLVVDSANGYFTTFSGNTIEKAPLSGTGGATTQLVMNEAQPAALAIHAGSLYWATTQGAREIRTCAATTCLPTSLATGLNAPTTGVAVDATGVYFRHGTSIAKCPLTGCAGGQPQQIATGNAGAKLANIAVDATSVYFTDYLAGSVMKLTPK